MNTDQKKSQWRPNGFVINSEGAAGKRLNDIHVHILDDGDIRLSQNGTLFITMTEKDLSAIIDIVNTVNDFS